MAKVLVKIKVMPVSPEVDKEALKEKVKETVEKMDTLCRGISDEPLAFGLYSINVMVEMEEKEGGTEPIENALNELEDVESAEVLEVSLA